jgi:UDP-N-acetylmuramoyl-L-alanyl-D-glutamate--2,6-diaminopimelate ligase
LAYVYVKGRGEVLETHTPYSVIIDYAHNGVSLKSIIETAAAYEHNRIIALYGSVGSRTEIRRKELGLVSGALCDLSILTSDDPEFEDPSHIIAEIARYVEEAGGKHVDIPDRAEAIRYALSIAEPGDILIFAGKGHEEFMKVKGEKLPFSEKKVIFEYLKEHTVSF